MNLLTGKMMNNKFTSGKYAGKLYIEVFELDREYIKYALQQKLIEL